MMRSYFTLPDYERIAESVGVYDPSELHGMLCGMLCIDNGLTGEAWLAQLRGEMPAHSLRDQDSLHELYKATAYQINSEDYDFALLLPDDEMNLSVRAESLGYWCQGFLAGLGLAGLRRDGQWSLPVEADDFLADVSEISKVGLDGSNAAEEDEIAYTEIVEYLRIGVVMLNQQLLPPQLKRAAPASLH